MPEAVVGTGVAAAADHSASAAGTTADDLDGRDASSTAESVSESTDSGRDSAMDVAGAEDRVMSREAASVEGLSSDSVPSMDASQTGDGAWGAAGAQSAAAMAAPDTTATADDLTAADKPAAAMDMDEVESDGTAEATPDADISAAAAAMTGADAPSASEAMTDTGRPSSAEAMTGSSNSDSGASAADQSESRGSAVIDEEAFVVGVASGTVDTSDDARDRAGESTTAEATSGAAGMAAEMPRTTRRERALADLIAGLPPEGSGWVLGNGTLTNPEGYPLKGNASSRIYHAPGGQSYDVTIAEICFATAGDARSAGFRPRQGDPGAEDVAQHAGDSSTLPPTDESGAIDIVPASVADEVAAADPVAASPSDIPSEFVSHLVGTPSSKSDSQVNTDDLTDDISVGAKRVDATEDVAPMGIAAVDSETVGGSDHAAESQPALSRSEQALQDLIATLPPEGRGWVRGTHVYTTPPGYPVKGNASSHIYHLPGGQNYQATIPEICFATVDDARMSGFRPRHGDPAEADWSLVEETPEGPAMGIGHSDVTGAAGSSRAELQLQEIIAGLPPEGSGWVRGTGAYTTPYGYPIKGNASSRIYHVPGGHNYQATIPEVCFASIDAARAGGFRPRHGDPAEPDWSLVEVTPGTEPIGIAAEPNAADIDTDVAAIMEGLPSDSSGWRLGDGTLDCPASHPIKGNSSSRIFHVEDGRSYKATIPEFCFATEEDAIAAGFRRARA